MKIFLHRWEFDCPCCGENEVQDKLLEWGNSARVFAGIPFTINSGYRCTRHNAKVNGSPKSAHLGGWAMDIAAENSVYKFYIVRGLISAGFSRIGIYERFIHADLDPDKVQGVIWYGKN